jgi:hypothetical protein
VKALSSPDLTLLMSSISVSICMQIRFYILVTKNQRKCYGSIKHVI